MSKLVLDFLVPAQYDKAKVQDIVRVICQQVNQLSEGAITARYQAQASVPTSVAAQVGDLVFDSNVTVQGAVGAQYVRWAWICTTASPTASTFVEMRFLTGT